MKKLFGILAATVLSVGGAHAASFTVSDFAGTGNFGSATAACDNAGCTGVTVMIDMAPNVLLDTGSHFPLTLSLVGTGRIDPTSVVFAGGNTFTVEPHLAVANYSNSPFGKFTDAISADCGSGGSSGGCGSTLTFDITNFMGFAAATDLFNGNMIFAAVDILLGNCTGTGPTGGGCTGAVGLTANLIPTPFASNVPLPGAVWLFGSGLLGVLALGKRKKKAAQLAV